MRLPLLLLLGMTLVTCLLPPQIAAQSKAEAPLFRDFVGLCGHTVNFKPDLYYPVCRIVRDYHPVSWDLGEDTSKLPDWPFAKNRVDWSKIYQSWHAKGFKISVCLQFDNMSKDWKDMPKDAYEYAKAFAANFGPGGPWPYVETIELGNEPGLYDDATYKTIFQAMSKGIREGNPKVRIATCNVEAAHSDRYWKGADLLKDLSPSYDILRIHRYAIAEGWPVWRRSYPEDPKTPFLSTIQALINWRDKHAPEKPLWVSEFGWDSSTKKPDPKGEWAKWIGSTDEEQARYLVRSFFILSRMGVDRAFVFFFNDEDKPQLHASSGLTRNYQPKPSYHAIAWMLRSLENYRFSRVVQESLEDGYIYEFTPEKRGEPLIRALWHPTKDDHRFSWTSESSILKAERMPLQSGEIEPVSVQTNGSDKAAVNAGQRPVLLWIQDAP